MKRVLILGGRAPVALYLAKLLNTNTHRVFVADSVKYFISKKADYIEKSFVLSKPNLDIEKFVVDINKIIDEFRIDFIIPTCEEAFQLSKVREKINTKVFVDDFSKMMKLHSKYDFIELCDEIGITVPLTRLVNNKMNFAIDTKAVIKPVFSRFGNNVQVVSNKEKLVLKKDCDYVLQEFLEGMQICSYSIAVEGEILAHTSYKTKYVVNMGTNIFFEYEKSLESLEIARKIVRELNYTGQISFDFIKTEKGLLPIECNPRATSGLSLIPFEVDILEGIFNESEIKI